MKLNGWQGGKTMYNSRPGLAGLVSEAERSKTNWRDEKQSVWVLLKAAQ
jgi:hypothetical protein